MGRLHMVTVAATRNGDEVQIAAISGELSRAVPLWGDRVGVVNRDYVRGSKEKNNKVKIRNY